MSNENKSALLGLNFSTATQRLRKLILFDLLQRFGQDTCFRCGQQIEDTDDLSIEHKEPWQGAADPKASFFDLENIAFSHLRCNTRHERTRCPAGHPYSDNKQHCLECERPGNRERWHRQGYAARRKTKRMEDRLRVGQRSLKP